MKLSLRQPDPTIISFCTPAGKQGVISIPRHGLIALPISPLTRSIFRSIVAETRSRAELDAESFVLRRTGSILSSAPPPSIVISLHGFSQARQSLAEMLNLLDFLTEQGRLQGARCPDCDLKAEATSSDNLADVVLNIVQGTPAIISISPSLSPDEFCRIFSHLIVDDHRWDVFDIPNGLLAAARSVSGIIFQGLMTEDKIPLLRNLISKHSQLLAAPIEIRQTNEPYTLSRFLGILPTCPSCGRSTPPISSSSILDTLHSTNETALNQPLSWYPSIQHFLHNPPSSIPKTSLPPSIADRIGSFPVGSSLTTRVADMPLEERLALRFQTTPHLAEGLLLIELPSYGLTETQALSLQEWITHQKEYYLGVITLGGSEVLSTIADAGPNMTILEEQPQRAHPAPRRPPPAPTLPSTPPNKATELDLAHYLCDRQPSRNPFLCALPLFKRLTALYAKLTAAKVLGISSSCLSLFGQRSLRCDECGGQGRAESKTILLPCNICLGSRYQSSVNQLVYRGLPFTALFNHSADSLLPIFENILPVQHDLTALSLAGLGGIALGTSEDTMTIEDRCRFALMVCLSNQKGGRISIRGMAGIFSDEERTSLERCFQWFAQRGGVSLTVDGVLTDLSTGRGACLFG